VFEKAKELGADIYHFHDPELISSSLKLKANGHRVIFDIHENTDLKVLTKNWIPFYLRKIISFLYVQYENRACEKFDMVIVPQISMFQKYKDFVNTALVGIFPHLI